LICKICKKESDTKKSYCSECRKKYNREYYENHGNATGKPVGAHLGESDLQPLDETSGFCRWAIISTERQVAYNLREVLSLEGKIEKVL